MPEAARPVSIRRIIGAVLATALTAATIHFALQSRRYAWRFEQWQTAKPVSVAVDLSQRGTTEAPFVQTCQTAHRESIFLQVADGGSPPDLADLRAKIEILDAAGKVIVDTTLPGSKERDIRPTPDPENGIELAYFWPFDVGDYTLRLTITSRQG